MRKDAILLGKLFELFQIHLLQHILFSLKLRNRGEKSRYTHESFQFFFHFDATRFDLKYQWVHYWVLSMICTFLAVPNGFVFVQFGSPFFHSGKLEKVSLFKIKIICKYLKSIETRRSTNVSIANACGCTVHSIDFDIECVSKQRKYIKLFSLERSPTLSPNRYTKRWDCVRWTGVIPWANDKKTNPHFIDSKKRAAILWTCAKCFFSRKWCTTNHNCFAKNELT